MALKTWGRFQRESKNFFCSFLKKKKNPELNPVVSEAEEAIGNAVMECGAVCVCVRIPASCIEILLVSWLMIAHISP